MPTNLDKTSNDYIGAGFAFPVQVNVQGSIHLSDNTSSLEESIKIILGTHLGERVYRPNFGSRLSELVFEPINTQTLSLIRLYVEEALEMWEPRMILKQVLTIPDPIEGKVEIDIQYTPKDKFEIRSLVFPFYLLPPESEEN